MTLLLATGFGVTILVALGWWQLRVGRSGRLPPAIALVSILPLLALGAAWPSVHTILAIAAFPGFIILAAAVAHPGILRRKALRAYAMGSMVLAPIAFAIQVSWLYSCPELCIVVPDGFRGEAILVADHQAGTDLAAHKYLAVLPPSGRLPIKDDDFMFKCFAVRVRYSSGRDASFKQIGTRSGRGPIGNHFSTEFDGTEHRWLVE